MANHKSAKKAIRKIETRTLVNKNRKSRIRTFVKKAEQGLETGAAGTVEALRVAESELMRGVSKGVIHKNTAARKVSRLAKRLKALSAK